MKPELNQIYYVPSLCKSSYRVLVWKDDMIDRHYLEHGLVFYSEENAVLYSKALLKITKP